MAEEPPFQRIVAELSRRIREGELAPGDRVPSTRRIARDWGVAMATAAKALNTLRHQGLVHAEPRSGTVVAEPPSPAARGQQPPPDRPAPPPGGGQEAAGRRSQAHELTRERVIRAAIEIADAEGLESLSMRAIAARLGAATMSTYRHVAGKEELVALMADTAYGELGYPPDDPAHPLGWRPRIERAARTLWTLYRRHPWLAQVDSLFRPLPLPHLLDHDEQILRALAERGLTPHELLNLSIVLYSQIQSLAQNIEREAQAQAASGISGDEWLEQTSPALTALVDDGSHPTFTRMMGTVLAEGFDLDLDAVFELGLGVILDGLAFRLGDGAARVDG